MNKVRSTCRCCGSQRLWLYLDLGEHPLANSYHHGDVSLPRFPLQVVLCEDCYLSQLNLVVDPTVMFSHYLYVSGTTGTFRNHCRELARDAAARLTGRRPQVLDIAANDGTLLEAFRDAGCEVAGVDPAANLRQLTEAKGIPVIVDYWGPRAAQVLGRTFDIITGTNVFAHVDDIQEFVLSSRNVLRPDGLLILEFPYADRMIAHCEFDTIYHEHLSYFLLSPLAKLFTRLEFQIVDAMQTPIHGGSLRLFLRSGTGPMVVAAERLCRDEQAQGLLTRAPYERFAQRAVENSAALHDLVADSRRRGRRVIGYGASAKGNTLLNFAGPDLDYIVDANPLKTGWQTPGRNITIEPISRLREEPEDLDIVLLAWNFQHEIARIVLRERPGRGDFFLTYVPDVNRIAVSALAT